MRKTHAACTFGFVHTTGAPNRLGELRRQRGLRLIDVAAEVSKDTSVVSRYESGSVQIPDDVKGDLAAFFGVSRAYLMGWDDSSEAA